MSDRTDRNLHAASDEGSTWGYPKRARMFGLLLLLLGLLFVAVAVFASHSGKFAGVYVAVGTILLACGGWIVRSAARQMLAVENGRSASNS